MPRSPRPRRRRPGTPRAEAPSTPRRRLDAELVRRSLTNGIAEARELIARGLVLVGGADAANPSRLVAAHEAVTVTRPGPAFVSRGGEKLAAAIARFEVSLASRRVLDAGASTGGFTDCALQAGAESVVALDVGRGQLHQRLRSDERVEVHDRTNVRHVDPAGLWPPADVVLADLSFISLRRVVGALLGLVGPGGDLIWLVKPQFEATKPEVDAGRGVIGVPEVWERVLREVSGALEEHGATIMGMMTSPLRGADGNVEFFIHAVAPARICPVPVNAPDGADAHVRRAVAEAVGS